MYLLKEGESHLVRQWNTQNHSNSHFIQLSRWKSFTEEEESLKMWRYFQNRRKAQYLLGSMIGGKRKESRYNVNHRSKARERKKHTKNAWCLVIVLWYTRTIVSRAQGEIGSFPLGVLFDSDSDNNSDTKLLNKLGSVDSWHRSPSQTCSFLENFIC